MTLGVLNDEGYLSNTLILPGQAGSGCGAGQSLRRLGCSSAASAREVPEVHERRSPRATSLRRSQGYFFFLLKAGPKSGLTWQFWILPAHIESSWRPWWFVRER